jgi:hypothetical protein
MRSNSPPEAPSSFLSAGLMLLFRLLFAMEVLRELLDFIGARLLLLRELRLLRFLALRHERSRYERECQFWTQETCSLEIGSDAGTLLQSAHRHDCYVRNANKTSIWPIETCTRQACARKSMGTLIASPALQFCPNS